MELWIYPMLTTALIFLVVIPLATVGAKLGLSGIRRRCDALESFGATWVCGVLLAPVAVPVVWSFSAALHQAEPGRILASCLHPHEGDPTCTDALALALFLILIPAVVGGFTAMRQRGSTGFSDRQEGSQESGRERAEAHRDRVIGLCARHPVLDRWAERIRVVEAAAHRFCTVGFIRPRIEVDMGALGSCDDDEVVAALLHEVAHGRGRDPLRFALARVAMGLNPLGRLLAD